MSSAHKNLSDYKKDSVPDGKKYRIGIVVSEWNFDITGALLQGALDCLSHHGVKEKNIFTEFVPGSFELPMAAQLLVERAEVDAVICLGCVIQGETRHFEFICHAVSDGIMDVSLAYTLPVIFGVLTTDTMEQASDRAGGKHGNKGTEAAVAALKMIQLQEKYPE